MWPPPQYTPPVWQPSSPLARRPVVPARVAGRASAQPGDVLVRQRPGPPPSFALSAVPGLDQVTYPSMADATRSAAAYARQHGVDVWSEERPGRLARLSHFRDTAGGGLPVEPPGRTRLAGSTAGASPRNA